MKKLLCLVLLGSIFLSGCTASTFDGTITISPPSKINATMYGKNPHIEYASIEFQGEGTIQVLARIDSVQEYATTHRHEEGTHFKGHWHLVSCTVLRVEKGQWPYQQIIFPAAEGSGGFVSFIPLELIKGRFFVFGMRETDALPEITFYSQRSHFPSHGPIDEPHWSSVSDREERIRRINGIRNALGIDDVRTPFSSYKQNGRFLVVDTWIPKEYGMSWIHVMDANTFERIPFLTNNLGQILIVEGEELIRH